MNFVNSIDKTNLLCYYKSMNEIAEKPKYYKVIQEKGDGYRNSIVPQATILEFIEDYIEKYRISPSMAEIGEGTGNSITNVRYHVGRLDSFGLLSFRPGIPRSFVITAPDPV